MKKVICLILCVVLCAGAVCGCSEVKTITGNEWLVKLQISYDNAVVFCEGMDEVYELYLLGSITGQDFLNEHAILDTQYNVLRNEYIKLKNETTIEAGSHSYVSIRGSEAIEELYSLLGELLDNTIVNNLPVAPEKMMYVYMAYEQKIKKCFSDYAAALLIYNETIDASSEAEG